MDFNQSTNLITVLASISLGAFLGAVRSKLIQITEKNILYYIYYIFSFLVLFISLFYVIFSIHFLLQPNWFALTVTFIAITSNLLIFWFTKNHLHLKNVYNNRELDPIINDFTNNSDRDKIRLFGGDLNFFGDHPSDMDNNIQYKIIKSGKFNNILILCEEPRKNIDKIRYGKILNDIPETELRFYKPEQADLKVRGRMKEMNGVTKLLIYTKVKKGYKALETDTANTGGALYNNIWGLVWSLARVPDPTELEDYKRKSVASIA